jgi:hypothetical protein
MRIFRSLNENPHDTLLLDEVDALFGHKIKAAQNPEAARRARIVASRAGSWTTWHRP